MKRKGKIYLSLLLTICLIFTQTTVAFAGTTSVKAAKAKYAINTGKVIEVVWSKVKNVSGYEIYRSDMGGKYTKIATVNKSTTTKYVDKKAKLGHINRYKVRTFKTVDGKKKYGKYSNVVYGMLETEELWETDVTLKNENGEFKDGSYLRDFAFDGALDVYVDGDKVTDFKAYAWDDPSVKVKKVDGKLKLTLKREGKTLIAINTSDGKAGLYVCYPSLYSVATKVGSSDITIEEAIKNGNTFGTGTEIAIADECGNFNVLYKGQKTEDYTFEVLNYDWMGDEALQSIKIEKSSGKLCISPKRENQHYVKITVEGESAYYVINS